MKRGERYDLGEGRPSLELIRQRLYLDDKGVLRWRNGKLKGSEAGSINSANYICLDFVVDRVRWRVIRGVAVFALHHGRMPEGYIKYKNGNTTDDHPSNLVESNLHGNRTEAWDAPL